MNQEKISLFVDQIQSQGRYSFGLKEIIDKTGQIERTVRRTLERQQQRGRIVLVSRGFYVIIPLEYKESGILPPEWFIHDLMAHLNLLYYVGLLSAAALHGAAHQRPQEFQVLTEKQLRPILVKGLSIRFFVKKNLDVSFGTIQIKTETGFLKASGPELTAIDLIKYPIASGGLGNIATILLELAEKISADQLILIARKEKSFVYVQRLGYLLDNLGFESKTVSLAQWLIKQNAYPVLLDPAQSKEKSSFNKKWRIFENQIIEVESL